MTTKLLLRLYFIVFFKLLLLSFETFSVESLLFPLLLLYKNSLLLILLKEHLMMKSMCVCCPSFIQSLFSPLLSSSFLFSLNDYVSMFSFSSSSSSCHLESSDSRVLSSSLSCLCLMFLLVLVLLPYCF